MADRVVGIDVRADKSFERSSGDHDVQAEEARPRQVRCLVEVVGPDDRREVRPVFVRVEREECGAFHRDQVGVGIGLEDGSGDHLRVGPGRNWVRSLRILKDISEMFVPSPFGFVSIGLYEEG